MSGEKFVERRQEDPVTAWERHGQTITAAVVLLVLSWVGVNVNDNAKNSAVMASQITDLKIKVSELERSLSDTMSDRYRGRDADRDFSVVNKELDRVRTEHSTLLHTQASFTPRFKALEDRVSELERKSK